jgi:hypothetical protein
MARANGQGKNWARILSTALFGLATLELITQYPGSHLGHFVLGGQAQPVIHYGSGVTVLALIVPALTWLAGAVAVWLLWRPASHTPVIAIAVCLDRSNCSVLTGTRAGNSVSGGSHGRGTLCISVGTGGRLRKQRMASAFHRAA